MPRFLHCAKVVDVTASESQGVVRGTASGFDAWLVTTPHATAAISIFGGQVLSYRPTEADDVLWVSPLAATPPTPIRGGIPICWPYFGKENQTGDVPSHGYARTATWQVVDTDILADDVTQLRLAPLGLERLTLRLELTVRVGATLEIGVRTTNLSDEPAILTEALHNYLRVSDATDVHVEGLSGKSYEDKFDDLQVKTQDGDWRLPDDVPRSDRLYPDAGGTYRLVDPGFGRTIRVTGDRARTAVVWNPGADVASDMADVGPHWREFVCVETANAGPDLITVAAGATVEMWQTIALE